MKLEAEISPANNGLTLPGGWVKTKLGAVIELNPPKPLKDAVPLEAEVTFVPMPAVDAQSGTIASPERRFFMSVRKGYTAFRDGDVIFAKITPCMENGKAAIARNLIHGLGFGSTEFHVLRPSGSVIPEYVFYYVRQESFRRAAEAEMTGSVGQKRVPSAFLRNADFPLPLIAEQKRIVAKIEELLPKVNGVRERLIGVKEIMKRFRQSVLSAACYGRLTEDWRLKNNSAQDASSLLARIRESFQRKGASHGGQAAAPTEGIHELFREQIPESWDVAELKWLCSPGRAITYGILKPGPHQNDGIPYIRVADFPKNCLEQSAIRKTSRTIAAQYERSSLRSGDVLLSIRGTVGRVCRVPRLLEGSNITQDTARISVHPEVSPEYVAIYLKSPMAQKTLEKAMKGVAVRGVNIGDVRALQVPIPPRTEQQEIVRRVESLFRLADKIERRVEAELSRTQKMTQAILAKAFRGELVQIGVS
jgi:type I restriction enzyme, S subunit